MSRTLHRLTEKQIKALTTPGLYADGGGLYFRIAPSGARGWIFRYMISGRRRDMGLGSANHVGLSAARGRVAELRASLVKGIDPLAEQEPAEDRRARREVS